MGPAELRAHVESLATIMLDRGGDIYALIGETEQGKIPIGVVAVDFAVPAGAARQAEPHVYFFPEASPRNKLECSVKFLIDLKKENNVVIIAGEKDWGFFNHMCLYGVIRAVGKYRGYFEDGSAAMIYQDAKAL
jgi:hypothetical protein